ncbi:MAG: hypothetical protein QXV17_04880 [Candidatus Micrarchaeaceae archaeon]
MSLFKKNRGHTDISDEKERNAEKAVEDMKNSTEVIVKEQAGIFEAVSMIIVEHILHMEAEGKLTDEEWYSVFGRKDILPVVLGEAYEYDVTNWSPEKIDEAIHNSLKTIRTDGAGAWAEGEGEERVEERERWNINEEKFKEFVKGHIKVFETGSKIIVFRMMYLYVTGKISSEGADILLRSNVIRLLLGSAYIYGIGSMPVDIVDGYILKSLKKLLETKEP